MVLSAAGVAALLEAGLTFRDRTLNRRCVLAGGLTALAGGCATAAPAGPARFLDTTLDAADGRRIAVRLAAPRPAHRGRLGLIAFSHGANSNNALYDRVLGAIAEAGFLVAAPTHVDAETNPDRARYDRAAVYATRIADLGSVSDSVAALAAAAGLAPGAIDPLARGVAGHSYGALLALQLAGAGARAPGAAAAQSIRDPRVRAAVALSPPGPLPGFLEPAQFDTIAAPILIATGQKDVLPGFVDDWRTRLIAQERSPALPAYAAVLPDADHYYGGLIGRFEVPGPPQTESLALTLALTGQFLRATVLKDAAADRALKAAAAAAPGLDWRARG